MKYLLWLVLVITTLFIPKNTVYASCQRMDNTDASEQQCKAAGKYPRRNYSLTIAGTAQCTNSPGNGVYAVCCDELTEANAVDSVRAPLCGSSEERGKANSTCYDCGSGNYKCDGLDFSLGSTDPFISQIHNPVNPGDTNMDQVWRIPNSAIPNITIPDSDPPKPGFLYNGVYYPKPSGDLIVCGSNNQACGSSEECTNIKHPDVNNRGNGSKQGECKIITRDIPAAHDTDINVKKRGWINATEIIQDLIDVPGPTDPKAPQLSTMLGDSLITSPTITGLYQVNLNDGKTPIPKDERSNWGATLIELSTNAVIRAPKSGYEINSAGYAYTVLYATENDMTLKGTLEDNAVYGYTIHFVDFNVNPEILRLYRQNEQSGRKQLLAIPCGYPLGNPKDAKVKVGIADTGTFIDPRIRKDWWHEPANTSCANIPPGLVNPLPTQSCTETGAPDITTKVPIPNLVSFGLSKTIKEGNSIFSIFTGVKNQTEPRPIGELFGFKDNTVKVPKVYERLGRQLKNALPFLTPAAIEIQPIVHELTHSGASTYCYANDKKNGITQAFPVKGTITIPAPGLNQLRESSKVLSGLMGTETVSSFELKNLGTLNPNVLARINLNPICDDEPPTAFNIREKQVLSSDPEEYEVPESDWPVYFARNWIMDIVKNLGSLLGKKCGEEVDCKLDLQPEPESYVRFKSKTPYIGLIMKELVKDQTGKPVGALATLQPASLQTRTVKPGKVEGLTMIQQLGSNSEDIRNVALNFKNAKTIEVDGEQLSNCLLHPQSLQKNLDYDCNFSENDVTPDRELSGGTDPAFPASDLGSFNGVINDATTNRIPACVLEGVKYAETGTRTDFSGVCTVNACSAAGPFQITVGQDASGDTHCRSCGASWADGNRTCSDGWPGNWPETATDPSPCSDVSRAADRAVQMLQEKATIRCETLDNRPATDQREAIITAAGSYFGDNVSINRFGGCSYGEFVYKHCDGSYVCGTANVDLDVKYEQCRKQRGL